MKTLITLCMLLQAFLPTWKEGFLDIHAIATGHGESILIVMPDGTTMLTDCGDTMGNGWACDAYPDSSRAPGCWVAQYVRDMTGRESVDYFLLSHFHGDHSGATSAFKDGHDGYRLAGITDFAEEMGIGKIVDRGYPSYDFPSEGYVQKEPTLNYVRFVRHQVSSCGASAEKFEVGSHDQFKPLHSRVRDFEIWNLAGGCFIDNAAAGPKACRRAPVRPMYEAGDNPERFDENMFSCAQLIRYGKFSYYQGGDLPGGYWVPSKPTPHKRQYDAQVAELIGGPVTVIKAGHHGTRDSSSPYFLWTLRPRVIFFPSYESGHPSSPTVERMLDPLMPVKPMLFSTSDVCAGRLGDLWNDFTSWGHIVIRVYPGGEAYQIFVLDPTTGKYGVKYVSEVFKL